MPDLRVGDVWVRGGIRHEITEIYISDLGKTPVMIYREIGTRRARIWVSTVDEFIGSGMTPDA